MMTGESDTSKSWEAIGKIATIVTIFASLIGVWIWYKTPSASLVATIEYGTYRTNPETVTEISELKAKLKESKPRSHIAIDSDDTALLAAAAAADAAAEAAQMAAASFSSTVTAINGEGYVRATVTNKGDIPVKDVTYRAPDSKVSLITREDKTFEVVLKQPTVNLGELKPNQSIEVYSWLYTPTSRYSLEDEISISHAEGRGSIQIEDDPSVADIILISPYSMITLLLFLFLLGVVFSAGFKSGVATQESKSEGPAV